MTALQTITATMRSWGWSPAQIAGAEGNLSIESGFDPTKVNVKEGALGIAQWRGGRRAGLQAYARAHGTTETDLNAQLGFMHEELSAGGPESGAYRALMAANTPQTAAVAFDSKYERSDGTTRAQRIATAEGLATSLGATEDPAGSYDPVADPNGGGGLLGVFSGWQAGLASIGLKLAAAGVAGTLIVVGAHEALKERNPT